MCVSDTSLKHVAFPRKNGETSPNFLLEKVTFRKQIMENVGNFVEKCTLFYVFRFSSVFIKKHFLLFHSFSFFHFLRGGILFLGGLKPENIVEKFVLQR